MIRRKIHTNVKVLVSLNALPAEYKALIHPSQLSRYANTDPAIYFGQELSLLISIEMQWIKQFGDFPAAKKLSIGILKLFVFFRSVMQTCKGFKTAIRKNKPFFVSLFKRFNASIPLASFSKLIGISETTMRSYIRAEKSYCPDSFIRICRKLHPNQLLDAEINKIRQILADEQYKYWPLASLYFFALKNKLVCMSKSTWYKYATRIKILRLKPHTRKIKTTGIRAHYPNQLWHADVTYFFTPDRIKLYIYTVVDNFSRMPLCVKVSDKLCGKFRVQTFKEAFQRSIELHVSVQKVQLMTDGGSENFNSNVSQFIHSSDELEIKHIKALADGWPSNSMAEAFHYTLKCFYLNHMHITHLNALNKALDFVLKDYACKRPHAALNGLTPLEAFTSKPPELISFTSQIHADRAFRVAYNQNHNCSGNCQFNKI